MDSQDDSKKFGKDELGEIARIGSDILKKTVSSGLDAILDLKGNIPKEAVTFISNRKDELIKGISKEVVQSVINGAVDTFFSVVRQHRLEVSIRIRKNEETPPSSQKSEEKSHRGFSASRKKHQTRK